MDEFTPALSEPAVLSGELLDPIDLIFRNFPGGHLSPLYELAEWIDAVDLRALGFTQRPRARFTDDRFGRALDKLYDADRASLQTGLVLSVIRAFDVTCERIQNDSTSVKACGRIPGRTRTRLELHRG